MDTNKHSSLTLEEDATQAMRNVRLPLELKTGKMFRKQGTIEHRAQVMFTHNTLLTVSFVCYYDTCIHVVTMVLAFMLLLWYLHSCCYYGTCIQVVTMVLAFMLLPWYLHAIDYALVFLYMM